MRALELKIPPPLVALVMAVFMWLLSRAAPALTIAFPSRVLFAIVFAVAGLVTGFTGVATFRRARTTVNPMKPNSSTSLVSWGIYAITRNPMYLGGLIILTGWAIFLSNALACVLLPLYVIYINVFQIVPEERALTSLFPKEFAEYKTHTRRWI